VNFLLLDPDEVDAEGRAVLRGRRAEHARTVLRCEVGQTLRAGIVDGPLATATVDALTDDELAITLRDRREPPPPSGDTLLLAVPRPRVLLRMLADAAALGFAHVILFRSWRVDKSWLSSSAMQPEIWRNQLLLGLEQAGRTHRPTVAHFPLFKPMVEDELPRLDLPRQRFVAHPAAPTDTAQLTPMPPDPLALAIGPDGGFLPYEVDRLVEQGFTAIRHTHHALRTETALAVLFGQLDLLRRRR
jgi:RsmE family RNA methyltransferase